MPICRGCSKEFDGVYQERYCGDKCRLLSRTEKCSTGCWEWRGGKTTAGYGLLNIKGAMVFTHRLAYRLFIGQIGDNLCVCHRCDNPCCVNPDHLFVGTNAENAADMASKGRAAWKNRSMPVEIRAKLSAIRKLANWKPSAAQIAAAVAARAELLKDPAKKDAIYEKMRGNNNPNFGKKMDDEQRAKLDQSHWSKMRGKKRGPMSDETKERISAAHKHRK